MANLRVIKVGASDSRTIFASFTDDLDPFLTKSNVTVESQTVGVPDAAVISLDIQGNIMRITTQPMTPNAAYLLKFQSTDSSPFINVNGTSTLFQDGKTNVFFIRGPEEPENFIRNTLITYLSPNETPYNPARGTLIRTILNVLSTNFSRALFDIRQTKNESYLNARVTDERKVRGKGPTDRLNQEGAFDVIRVGKTQTDATLDGILQFDSFPFDPITLQTVSISAEDLEAGADGDAGTFDRFVLTVDNGPVTKLKSLQIEYSDGYVYQYDITTFGYQLKNPRYDTKFASTFVLLDDNQIKINEDILDDPGFPRIPVAGDTMTVSYEYKNLGIIVDEDSVSVTKVLEAIREPTPALLNVFSLDFAPVVTSSGSVATSGGVQFLDPNSATPFLTTHPAFTKEIPFKLEGLPKAIGEYAVDYDNGRVYVYGATSEKEGTGNYPPAATYKYRKSFVANLDYTYDSESFELVSSPLRDLSTQTANINYEYENTLIPGTDFEPKVHKEILNERIENRLLGTNSLQTLNGPITNAFKVFNETTSEEYGITRFNDNKVYFTSNNSPKIVDKTAERVDFTNVTNESLIVNSEFKNSSNVRILEIQLLNNRIMSITDDVIGSSYNSSVSFSRSGIFEQELYYDWQLLTVTANTDRLTVGKYQVDYRNGIVYVGVSNSQNFDIGTINYKKPVINPVNPHVLAVSDIYYSTNLNLGPTLRLNYISFGEDEITPSSFNLSDERFLNDDETMQYQVISDQITVTNDILVLRHLYDAYDLNNNIEPVNFADAATTSGNIITLDGTGVQRQETLVVGAGLTLTTSFISPGIKIGMAISAIRISDGAELIDGYETVVDNTITLSGASGAAPGDVVDLIYTVILTGAATPVVDYDRGGYYIDYTYLADEILITYEYGDNSLDFSQSSSVEEGDEYFVTYRFGALRDTLLPNFGSYTGIPEVLAFDTNLNRERYRDALIGILQSFINGPTIPSMETLVSSITKIEPEILESIFEVWSLGISYLYRESIRVIGDPALVPGKFDNGLLIKEDGYGVTFPVSSNLRLEEGTLEFWVIPEWNGLDNDATLTFSNLKKDGYAVSASNIFIGSGSYNPTLSDGKFSINRMDELSPVGLPSKIFTETGFFIYYDTDVSEWKVLAKDKPDGYTYSGQIFSSGEVYHVRSIYGLTELGDVIRSGVDKIDFSFSIDASDASSPDGYKTGDGYVPGYSFDGLQFMADDVHYLFDFADESDKNRFSIFKDGRGYINFRVWDRGGGYVQKDTRRTDYMVSADIQDWLAGQKHHVAVSWSLSSKDRRDEMHLYIDGFEVPNILFYGGRPIGTTSDRFRTVKPEIVAGTVPKNAVTGDALSTTQGSAVVSTNEFNFSSLGVTPGDIILILETGFTSYTILGVSGGTLTLDTSMPATLGDARFSVNPFTSIVSTNMDMFTNVAVSYLRGGEETELPGLRAELPGYSIDRNALNQNVLTILGDVETGDQILIRTLGLNHRRCREDVYIWGNTQSVLKTALPPPINLDEVSIKKIVFPLTSIGPANSSIIAGEFVATGLSATQPTNSTEGRQLTVRVTGGNVDFTTPTSITINGTTAGGPTSETLMFSSAESQTTTEKFLTISGVDVTTKPLSTSKVGLGVEIKEAYSITMPNGNSSYPVIRFAYKTQQGVSLEGNGGVVVSDPNGFFPLSEVGNLMVITSPPAVTGTYTIQDRLDNTTVRISPAPGVAFSGANYELYNINIGRSGFQNGFFFLNEAGTTNDPYPLSEGFYEFDYQAYLEVPFDPINQDAYVGTDFTMSHPSKAVIDELRILNYQLTDTRVGETLDVNEESVTTSYQSLNPFVKNQNTLMLLHFDEYPLENDSDFYKFANREYVQSGTSVNANFDQSICFVNRGLSFDNKGTLTTRSEGTIEFWVSPRFDTYNDPVQRFYFDATASVLEEVVSTTTGMVKVSGRVGEVLSVRLQSDEQNQGEDYFDGGSVADDRQTIILKRALPYQRTPVKVAYVPTGVRGDRISILKDSSGFIAFNVRANEQEFQVRTPVFWPRDTWHRVRATFKFNRPDNLDQIRLFVDGEERGILTFGSGILFGGGAIFGQTTVGVTNQILITNIDFTDTMTRYHIGQDFTGSNVAEARMDNFRLSNISRDPITIAGQPFDTNYSSNSNVVFPVIEDAFTTFLLNFDRFIEKVDDFAILRDENFGIFNFTLNIIDSFRILLENPRSEEILRSAINRLKPANAKVEINIVR